MEKSIYQVTKDGFLQYGPYINNSRHLPLVFDGLKPSYRRTIYGALVLCGGSNKFVKTAQLSGYVIGNFHPHGNLSVEGVITELVHAGILEGQGNFGSVTIMGDGFEAAAPRYTEVRLDPNWHSIFSELLPFVEWEDSYIGVKMPSYLPTPIPISLLFGSIGIGFGTGCLIPNFTAKSMYEAFKSNDPYKLKPAFRDIEFKYEKCDFEGLWDLGWARMTYGPVVRRGSAPDCGDGIYVKCDPSFIVPNMPLISERVRQDRLFIRDESDSNGDKLFIGRYPKLHEDMGYYEKYIKDTVEVSDTYRLVCTDGHAASLISLKTWLKLTYSRYLKYIERMKSTKIAKIDKEIRVLSILPKVGELIQSNKNISESQVIANFPDFDPADIRTCLGKPIRKLMKSEHESEINALRNQRNSIESINPDAYTNNILDKM